MKVLIGEISSYKAIVISRHLHKMYHDVTLIAYDNKRSVCRIHTNNVTSCLYIEKKDLDSYIRKLADCVRDYSIDVFIPVHSEYIGQILLHKELFGHALDYLGEYSDYIRLHEKDRLMEIARECGVRIPINYGALENARVPFVVKPTNKSSAKGVRYCMKESDKEKLEFKKGKNDSRYICQEYIAGQGCGYSVYCKDGEILCEYGHLRLAEYPTSGGSSVYRKGFVHPEMRTIVERVLKIVPWTGFAMFEFKLTPAGEVVLIEVNPRIWGSINQALTDGAPLFASVLGEKDVLSCQKNDSLIQTCLSPQVYLSLFIYALKGNFTPLKVFLVNRRKVSKDVSLWTDPRGFISMILRKL